MDTIVELDQQLFLFLNNLGNSSWDGFWIFMSDKFQQIPFYVLFLYFLYKTVGLRNTLLTLVVVALLITFADQTANLFKRHLVDRPRPCREELMMPYVRYVIDRCIGNAFFSGHAANAAAVGSFLALVFWKKYQWLAFTTLLWAFLVGYSRIYLAQHYPADVLTGFAVGTLYAFIAFTLLKYKIPKYN